MLTGELYVFFSKRWTRFEQINQEIAKSEFKLVETMTGEMKEKFLLEMKDLNKMKDLIRNKRNHSAPGLNGLTNPIVKIERESAAMDMATVMKSLLKTKFCPTCWKGARTILINKGAI